MGQTVFTANPPVAYPGMPADSGFTDDISAIVDEADGIEPGLVVFRGGTRLERPPLAILPPEAAAAADVDAIKTNIGSTAGVQSFTTADFNGAVGAGRISPPAKIDLVLSSHADWDATNATLVYEDEHGVRQTETLAIPNGGNATVSSTGYASKVISLSIPAQSGTGGTATLGTSASKSFSGGDILGIAVRTHHTRLDLSSSGNEVYEDATSIPVRRRGRIWVEVENAFEAGDRPLVRLTATGAEKQGAIRVGDTDSGDAVYLPSAVMTTGGGAGDLGILEINLP
jgi:hypothetical protein